MDRKYFNRKHNVYFAIGSFIFSELLIIIVSLPYLKNKGATIMVCGMAFFLLLSLYYASLSLGFPELTEDRVIHRNYFFRFYRKAYRYTDIEKIKIQSGGFHWPCMRVYVKGKRRFRFYSMDCMSQDSIKPFVEELRSHGVTVKCIPYFHNGKQIRL